MTEVGLYCSECGAKLAEPTSKFCSNCGRPTSLAAAKDVEEEKARGAIAGEEKTTPTMKENKGKEINNKKKKRMSKKKIVGIALSVIVGFFVIIIVAASTVPAGTVYKATSSDQITGVSQFVVLKDGSLYKARFSFIDGNERPVTSDANVTFAAMTQANQTIYERTFNVKAEQFQQYQLVLTGAPILAYAWQIDGGEMTAQGQSASNTTTTTRNATAGGGTVTTPAFDSGMKTGVLTVTLPNGKSFTAQTTFF